MKMILITEFTNPKLSESRSINDFIDNPNLLQEVTFP